MISWGFICVTCVLRNFSKSSLSSVQSSSMICIRTSRLFGSGGRITWYICSAISQRNDKSLTCCCRIKIWKRTSSNRDSLGGSVCGSTVHPAGPRIWGGRRSLHFDSHPPRDCCPLHDRWWFDGRHVDRFRADHSHDYWSNDSHGSLYVDITFCAKYCAYCEIQIFPKNLHPHCFFLYCQTDTNELFSLRNGIDYTDAIFSRFSISLRIGVTLQVVVVMMGVMPLY